jgi:hypothetical protein
VSQRTYPVGQAQVPFNIAVNKDGPVTGLTVKAKVLRPIDGAQWDFDDDTFKSPGGVVTPQLTLTESTEQPGLYVGPWNTVSVISDTDAIVIYESTATELFIQDDPVSFQTGVFATVKTFIEPVIDKTQRTMTFVFGLRNSTQGIIPTTAAEIVIKDELGTVLFTKNTTSVNGIHRAIFPNVDIVPNRVLLIEVEFTFGLSVFNTVDTIKVIGTSSD